MRLQMQSWTKRERQNCRTGKRGNGNRGTKIMEVEKQTNKIKIYNKFKKCKFKYKLFLIAIIYCKS